MEEAPVRAMVIGVSLFITMITFSALFIYYNTAVQVADVVNKRTDIASEFDYIVNSDNFETTLSGVEVRSLIRKYAKSERVTINIVKIGKDATNNKYDNVNNTWVDKDTGILKETKLDLINPSWTNSVEKVEKGNLIILNISLNVNN